MAKVLADLTAQVEKTVGALQSGTVFINGMKTRLEAAVAAAVANGATEAELAPVTEEIAALDRETANLSAAIAANSDAPPTDGGVSGGTSSEASRNVRR